MRCSSGSTRKAGSSVGRKDKKKTGEPKTKDPGRHPCKGKSPQRPIFSPAFPPPGRAGVSRSRRSLPPSGPIAHLPQTNPRPRKKEGKSFKKLSPERLRKGASTRRTGEEIKTGIPLGGVPKERENSHLGCSLFSMDHATCGTDPGNKSLNEQVCNCRPTGSIHQSRTSHPSQSAAREEKDEGIHSFLPGPAHSTCTWLRA